MKNIFLGILMSLAIYGNAQSRKTLKDNRVKTITVWRYDAAGKKTKEAVKTYDKNGNLTDEKTYDKNTGKQKSHITYKYNTSNKKIEETIFDANGKKKKTIRYTYKNGLKTQKEVLDNKGKQKYKKVYEITQYE